MAAKPALETSLHVDLDSDGQLQVKCHPMLARELGQVLRKIADKARDIVRREHSKTGRMYSSIQPYRGRRGQTHRIGPHLIAGTVTAGSARAKYTRFVHEGTRAHVIRARPGGALSFIGAGRNGKKVFTRTTRRLLSNSEIDDIYATGNTSDYERAFNRRVRRHRDWRAGRNSFMRTRDFDVATDYEDVPYAARRVVVDKVNHPGYRGHRFLNEAAAIVVGRDYGGRINLPKRPRG